MNRSLTAETFLIEKCSTGSQYRITFIRGPDKQMIYVSPSLLEALAQWSRRLADEEMEMLHD